VECQGTLLALSNRLLHDLLGRNGTSRRQPCREGSPSNADFEALWWRWCAGDARAFEEFITVLRPRLLRIANRKCQDLSGNDPENTVGETLMTIAAYPERISVKGNVVVQVLAIHRNKCVDQIRRLKSRPGSVGLFEEAATVAPTSGDAEIQPDSGLQLDIVRACLERLISDCYDAPARREVYRPGCSRRNWRPSARKRSSRPFSHQAPGARAHANWPARC
jgi:DNA-directed RNA polymerase specialized sigma24 family protein